MPSRALQNLAAFLRERMRMAHIYQPVMLKTLLVHGGRATRREIAAAILSEDASQLDYYERIVRDMPGRVLASHGVVVRNRDAYELASEYRPTSIEDVRAAIQLCDQALNRYLQLRGEKIWEHRAPGLGRMPGRLRYETLKRAGFRCELCGVSAEERALDVDHILPKSKGGPDTPENLQALCWKCNADKGAGDDLDLRTLRSLYSRRESGCLFCEVPRQRVVAENSLAYAVWDAHAVVRGHALVIPKRHVPDYFDLVPGEDKAVQVLLREMRAAIQKDDITVEGFNVGVNSGAVAGQTVFHCHVHLFPRRPGDVANPRGGVRHTIPGRGDY